MVNSPFASIARQGTFFTATCGYVVACMLLGGGTRSGLLPDVILQLLAVPLLVAGLWRYSSLPRRERPRSALVLPFLFAALPACQLAPLPPDIWTSLPGRELQAASFSISGAELPWAAVSVSPESTWLGLVALLPPATVFLATALLSFQQRRWLSLAMIAVGLVSLFLGMAQVAQGPHSPLRFMGQSTGSEAVGFFANRNHYAAMLYVLTLFAGVWAIDAAMRASYTPRQGRLNTSTVLPPVIGFAVLVAFLAAQMMARSRAGVILSIVALGGVFLLAVSDRRAQSGLSLAKLLLGGTAVAAVFLLQFALYRVADRFSADPLADARVAFAGNTYRAAMAFMPLGAGVGTFVPVYASFEQVQDTIANTYANRAHDDFLEFWLEGGAPAAAILAIAVLWFAWRSLRVWRLSNLSQHSIDLALARAGTMGVALVLAHSVVDYPGRTAAIQAIVAFLCGLLLPAPASIERHAEVSDEQPLVRLRHRARSQRTEVAVRDSAWTPPPVPADGVRREWMAQQNWPESWRRPARPRRPENGGGDDPA